MVKLSDLSRIKGFILLDKKAYKEIRDDPSSLAQAFVILALPIILGYFSDFMYITDRFTNMDPTVMDHINRYISTMPVSIFLEVLWIFIATLTIHILAKKLGGKSSYLGFLGLAGYCGLIYFPWIIAHTVVMSGFYFYGLGYLEDIIRLLTYPSLAFFLVATVKEAYNISISKAVIIVIITFALALAIQGETRSIWPPTTPSVTYYLPITYDTTTEGKLAPIYSATGYKPNQHFTVTYESTWNQPIFIRGVNITDIDSYLDGEGLVRRVPTDILLEYAEYIGVTVVHRSGQNQGEALQNYCVNVTANGLKLSEDENNNIEIPPGGMMKIEGDCSSLSMADKYSVSVSIHFDTIDYSAQHSDGFIFGNVI